MIFRWHGVCVNTVQYSSLLSVNLNGDAAMLHSLSDLQGYDILATDGSLGSVHDFYFDDRYWTIRYLVVDTGSWLPGRKVLIASSAAKTPDHERRTLSVSLTRQQIEDSPDVGPDLPLSRQHEIDLHDYYRWSYYWAPFPAGAAMAPVPPPAPVDTPYAQDTVAGDPNLRSVREVTGYYIAAEDGDMGHVEELIGDDERWLIPYFVVDTRNWLPGRKVLAATSWIDSVGWNESQIRVRLTRDAIKNSPEYDPSQPLTREDEERLHRHYERRGYWEDHA